MMHGSHATQGPSRRSSPPPVAHVAYSSEPQTSRCASQWNDPRALTHRMAHAPTPTRISSSSSLFGSSGAPVGSPPIKSHSQVGIAAKISPGPHGSSLTASPGPAMQAVPVFAMPHGHIAPEEVATARLMPHTSSWTPLSGHPQQRLSTPAGALCGKRSSSGCRSPDPMQRDTFLPRSSMPPPSCSSTLPSSPGKSFAETAWKTSTASFLPETPKPTEISRNGNEQYSVQTDLVPEATPARTDYQERELEHELRQSSEAVQRAKEANAKLNARLEEAEHEVSSLKARLSDERAKAEHKISFLKATLTLEKGKAEKTSVEAHAPHADGQESSATARLEDQLGSLQVRYNTLKKQYDGKGMHASEMQKQTEAKNKELREIEVKLEEKEQKLQESFSENKKIRQKMINFSKESQIADAEHRRIASVGRLMTPGEFSRMMKSSEARNGFSQENARLFHRSAELDTEAQLQGKVLSRLREKGLGNLVDEVWHDVAASDAIQERF